VNVNAKKPGRARRMVRIAVPILLVLLSLPACNLSLMYAWLTATPSDDDQLRSRQIGAYSFCAATIGCWVLAALCIYLLSPRTPGMADVCPTCRNNLVGLHGDAGVGVCPECGPCVQERSA